MYSLSNEEQLRVEYGNDVLKRKKPSFNTKNINNIMTEQENSENRSAQRRIDVATRNEVNDDERRKNV